MDQWLCNTLPNVTLPNHAHNSDAKVSRAQGDVHSSISTPSWYLDAPGMRSAIISLEFEDGFPVDGMPAVNMAADIWAQSLESVVPITILVKWDSLAANVLAETEVLEVVNNFEGAPFLIGNTRWPLPINSPAQICTPTHMTWWSLLENTHLGIWVGWQCPRWRVRHGHGRPARNRAWPRLFGSANHNNTSGFLGYQGSICLRPVCGEQQSGFSPRLHQWNQ